MNTTDVINLLPAAFFCSFVMGGLLRLCRSLFSWFQRIGIT